MIFLSLQNVVSYKYYLTFEFKNIADNIITRRKSKISLQLDKLKSIIEKTEFVNEEIDFGDLENESTENEETEKNKMYICNKLTKYNIFFYFTIKNKEFVFPFVSDLFNEYEDNVNKLIKNIVEKINDNKIIINCDNINYIVSLRQAEEGENEEDFYAKNYEMKPCKKKNLKPKLDSPSYSAKSLLKNIDNEKLSFICKSPLNIMLRENEEESGDNKYQFLFDED